MTNDSVIVALCSAQYALNAVGMAIVQRTWSAYSGWKYHTDTSSAPNTAVHMHSRMPQSVR